MGRHIRSTRWSWVAALAALALLVTACPTEDDPDVDAPDDDAEDTDDDFDAVEGFTYNTGIFEDTRTDNYWAYLDPDQTVWTGYVLGNTKCSLYGISLPAIAITPDIAAEDVPDAEEVDGEWQVEVSMIDAQWSDGEPVKASDLAFAFEIQREFELGANWANAFPEEVTGVEGVDDTTVRITFEDEPGLGVWPNQIGVSGVFMPEHFWEDAVEEARGSDNPSETLFAASGEGEPSCGSTIFEEWEPDAFVRVSANPDFHLAGQEVVQYGNGSVEIDGESFGQEPEGDPIAEYTTGPFFDDMVYTLYGAQDSAVLALRQGEVDFLFNPLGLERGLQEPVIEDENLEIAVNASYGMRYLAFNFRKEPMNDPAFRDALAIMIDRDFMAETVLGGVAFPLYTMMPPGNVAWYNEEVDEELYGQYRDIDEAERLEQAVEILTDAGYSWDEEPHVDDEGAPVEGSGMMMPDGSPVPDLVLNSLSPGYDPLRATYGLWIERWGQALGMPVTAELSGFGPVVDLAFPAEGEPEFDMFILGWSLGNPAFPTFYEGFWHSRNDPGNNAPGFNNDEYDDAVDRFFAATEFEEAYDILWDEIEPILAEEKPYIALFDTPIVEGYRHEAIRFPFTETLSGIQFGNGYPSVVTGAQ